MILDIDLMAQLARMDETLDYLKANPNTGTVHHVQAALTAKFGVKLPVLQIEQYLHTLEIHGFIHMKHGIYTTTMKSVFERTYSSYHKKTVDHEIVDYALKKISVSSAKLNKYIGFYAAGIAIISAAVPIIIYLISLSDVQKVSTTIPQLQKLQEAISKQAEQDKQFQDSVIEILNKSTRSDASGR